MRFLKLQTAGGKREVTSRFGGYWPEDGAAENQFYDMRNLCADAAPFLMPRGKRTKVFEGETPQGIHGGEKLLYADAGVLYYNHMAVGEVAPGRKRFVQMGARVLILPDKQVFDTGTQALSAVEARFATVGEATVSLSAWDGSDLGSVTVQATAPEEPADGALWLDTGSSPHRLCQYSAAGLCWTVRTDTAVRIAAKGIGALFRAGDGVFLSGCTAESLNGSHILLDAAADSIRFEGLLDAGFVQETPIVVTRKMPDLDFAVEVNNRIWGCNSAAREIYACALGDPFNWNTFAGTAADSYAASVGTLGAFTGAAAYQGAALFFKEGCVHKVLGSKPANFQVTFAPMLGVKAGAAASLALCEGNLLYQAADGVRVYGSGGTTLLSGRWGRDAAGCAGAVGGKYYLALPGRGVLCYDLASGLWHREDAAAVLGFAETGGTLYAQMRDGSVWRMAGEAAAGQQEAAVEWQAVTGEIALRTGAGSYVGGLYLRAMLEAGSTIKVEASYDESGVFQTVYEIAGAAKRTYELPILPRLCESMRLRLSGQGDMRIYRLEKQVRSL